MTETEGDAQRAAQKAAEEAFERCRAAKGLQESSRSAQFTLAGVILAAHKMKDYKALGYAKEGDFLYAEFGIRRATAYKWMRVAENYVEIIVANPNFAAIPVSRLATVEMYKLGTPENREGWCHKAYTLLPREWSDAIREARGLMPSDECGHGKIRLLEKCTICGKLLSYKDVE